MPGLRFEGPAPISWDAFVLSGGRLDPSLEARWNDLETQLRNAMAEARQGERYKRPAQGCSIYWKNRVLACFQEQDVLKREDLLDRVWWDAAGELTSPSAPLGIGALATYAIRLRIALKRAMRAEDAGNAAFERLTREVEVDQRTKTSVVPAEVED